MSDGFPFFDIVLFAMVAAFLVLRLRSVLGRRTGNERQHPDPFAPRPQQSASRGRDNIVSLPERSQRPTAEPVTGGPAAAGLTQIKLADPSFEEAHFLAGARAAFEMIVSAFAKGDLASLRGLLNDDVYANFAQAIDEREKAGESMETEIVGMRDVAIVDARLDGQTALVTVKYVTEQANVVRNAAGAIVDGDPERVETVTDTWTFARDTTAADPNWQLVATRSSD